MAHGVVHTTKVGIWDNTTFSFIHTADIDNGYLVSKGALATGEREIYNVTFDTTAPAFLVANPAWDYDDNTYIKKYDESIYTNKAGVSFRVYELRPYDRFEVSGDAVDTTLTVGDTVGMGATGLITKDATSKFQGKVIGVNQTGFVYSVGTYGNGTNGTLNTTNTFYLIEVVEN